MPLNDLCKGFDHIVDTCDDYMELDDRELTELVIPQLALRIRVSIKPAWLHLHSTT